MPMKKINIYAYETKKEFVYNYRYPLYKKSLRRKYILLSLL